METPGFFEFEDKTGAGYKGGSDKNKKDIKRYVEPELAKLGYHIVLDKLDNTSNKMRLYKSDNPNKFLLTQIIVVETIHTIDSRANSNISNFIVETTTEENRIETQLKYLKDKKVFLFLYIKRGGWFILMPYANIPKEHYDLTYRARPDRKNRMYIPAEFLPTPNKLGELRTIIQTYLK